MPFMAKCANCGYVLWANKRAMLNLLMKQHDSKSHHSTDSEDYDFCTWAVSVISEATLTQISMASKSPAFWRTLRTKIVS